MYNDRITVASDEIASDASNIRAGGNSAYSVSDFLLMYPGFGLDANDNPNIPEAILQIYIDLALTCIQKARFHGAWEIAVGYFVAHFATLYLQSTSDPTSGAAGVIKAGQAKGLTTSKGANDLSVGIDYSSVSKDLEGWAAWTLTNHGQNLATLARMYGKGGMGIR